MADALRIVIFGAGSIGCFIGGAWHAAGCDVAFIGRENIAGAVARNGMALSGPKGWKRRFAPDEIHFSTKPAALARADIVALCVRNPATEAAAKQIAVHARRRPAVISFQSGVSNVETLKRLLPKLEIVQAVTPFNIAYLGDGRWRKAASGDLLAEDRPVTRDLAGRVGGGPAGFRLFEDMAGIAWGKLLVNLNDAVNALSGKTLLEELGERDYRRVFAASMLEALDLLQAAGIEPATLGPLPPKLLPHAIAAPDLIFRNIFLRIHKVAAGARSSMHDDLAASRPTEVDYLNGEVVKLAAKLGRKAPINSALIALVKQAEAGVERSWSGKALRGHVLEDGRAAPLFGY